MNATIYYFFMCLLIACLMVYESHLLRKYQGKFLGNRVLSAISGLEFVWLAVSGLALYHMDFIGLSIIVPIIYMIHNLIGWGYGMYLLKQEGVVAQIESGDEDNIRIPDKLIDFTLTFAVIFFTLAALAILYQLMPEWFAVFTPVGEHG